MSTTAGHFKADMGIDSSGSLRRVLLGGALCGICWLLVTLVWGWWTRPAKFPTGPGGPPVVNVPSRLQQFRPVMPAAPSVPGLVRGTPAPVPGFENIPWMKSPTLSADLKSIVYVTYAGEVRLDDLVLSERDSITGRFTGHQVITSLSSPDREAHPALSPDGLELIFVRLKEPAELWVARRSQRGAEFGPPRRWQPQGDDFPEEHHDAPQFLDSQTALYAVSDAGFTHRRHFLARRSGPGAPFLVQRELSFANPWPRYFVTDQGRRAFCPSEQGIELTVSPRGTGEFLPAEVLLPQHTLGQNLTKFDDTFWVAPREDVIFFCGESGLKAFAGHRLWMVRL